MNTMHMLRVTYAYTASIAAAVAKRERERRTWKTRKNRRFNHAVSSSRQTIDIADRKDM